MGMVKKYKEVSVSSTWTMAWDVFRDVVAARFTNTSQALVCGNDADVFIIIFHHTHRLCNVIMELYVSSRNSWLCINISDLARKIGPQISEISLFAVLWFRIDQRLLISAVVSISIPRMSGMSGYFPCIHWLWLYNTIQREQREQDFLADYEWSGSSRCVYTSKWDGIATRFCPLQVENCTCIMYSSSNTRVSDAHFQILLSKMQKGPKMSQHVKKFFIASLPTCQAVVSKTQASQSWLIYGNMPIWTTSHVRNQLSMDAFFPTVIKCHMECAVKMMDLLLRQWHWWWTHDTF